MYTRQDYERAKTTRNRRLALACSALALALAALVSGMITRIWALTTFGAAAFVCLFYFILELKAMPYVRYARFLRDIQEGLTRRTEARFVSMSGVPRMNNGIWLHDFVVRVGNEDEDERLFYFDADKERPPIAPGQALIVTSFGNHIVHLEQRS